MVRHLFGAEKPAYYLIKLTPLMPQATEANAGCHVAPERAQSLGVYVHFPYCLEKCPYCDFLSVKVERAEVPHREYADAVVAELDRRLPDLGAHDGLRSLFFGGGTPSLWNPAELGRVLARIRERLPSPSPGGEVEVTVECNPSSFDEDRGRALVDAGVNRVSIGVQSLDAGRLKFLGRLHDAGGALEAVRAARRAGVPRISTDFIFGVAGQSASDAVAELLTLQDLGITHVSAYALTIEPGTRFGALARKNRLPLLGEDAVAESFVAIHEALTSRGFAHYEISNYALPGHEAQHNLGYWRGHEYLGLGCGAWGTVTTAAGTRVRYRNTPVPERYAASAKDWAGADLTRAGAGELVSEREVLSGESQFLERLMLGLRLTEGFDVEAAARETGVQAWTPRRLRAVEKLTARGQLRRTGARLEIPHDSWLLADGIIAELA
jgi:oxygen-independent coproporphyrinogen-3 oxidase